MITPTKHRKAFIRNVKQRMKAMNFTVYRLAQLTGVSAATLHKFLNEAQDIKMGTAIKIMIALDMDRVSFFKTADEKSDFNQEKE